MNGILTAGTAKIDISPSKGIELAGYPHYPRYNTGIHDPLYATCLYLFSDTVEVMFISLDLLFFSKKYYNEIVGKINKKTGIPERNIIISCTHTHSGPWASGRLDIESLQKGLQPDPDYIETLKGKIVSAATEAYACNFPAMVGTSAGICGRESGVGGNRRDPDGPSDPGVYITGIKDKNDVLRACIINYALHPTFLHADNTLVSADYPGYIRNYIEKRFPEAVMLFMQGCSGDQSSRHFRKGQSFGEADRVGTLLGAEASRVLEHMVYKNTAKITVSDKDLEISIRRFPKKSDAEEKLRIAEKEYRALAENNAPYIILQDANVRLLGAEDMLGYIIMLEKGTGIELYDDEKPAQILAVSIGEGRLVAMPGEVFVEFGLDIRNRSKNRTILIACNSNGCLPGYVYTRDSLITGGYEVDTSMLSEDMGENMADTAVSLLDRMER
jgi:neutral ceramidase